MNRIVNAGRRLPLGLTGLLALVWLAGCASSGKVSPAGEMLPTEPAVVERFDDGRVGFVIREVAELDGDLRDAFSTGVEALAAAQFVEAVEALETVVEAGPQVSAPYIDLAIAYRGKGERGKGEKPLQRALELVPGHPLASQEYALLLRTEGRFAEAREVLSTSLEAFPEYYPLYKNLAILCDLYLGDLDCAYDSYSAYSVAQPEDEQVKVWMAELQSRLNR